MGTATKGDAVSQLVELSDEVFAEIQRRAVPLIDTVDSVLRRVLGVDTEKQVSGTGVLMPLVKAGRLKPNDEIVWPRVRHGEVHRATVLETGEIRLADGIVVSTPSRACAVLSGNMSYPGWHEWRRGSDGVRLSQLRDEAGLPVVRRKASGSGTGDQLA
jgi:hypothetical protein